jgi:hypothetical protein
MTMDEMTEAAAKAVYDLDYGGWDSSPDEVKDYWRNRHATAFAAIGLAGIVAERDALAAFKAYVHKRLDEMGVPADPDSPHKAEGCRVGGRLDWIIDLMADAGLASDALTAEVARLNARHVANVAARDAAVAEASVAREAEEVALARLAIADPARADAERRAAEAIARIRDAVLHERYSMAEGGFTSEQVNSVLAIIDDFTPPAPAPPAEDDMDVPGQREPGPTVPPCVVCGETMTLHPNGNFWECAECRSTVPAVAWKVRLEGGGTLPADLYTTIDYIGYHARKTDDGRRLLPMIREALRLLGREPTNEEVSADLAAAGIDMRPAYERMRKMIADRKNAPGPTPVAPAPAPSNDTGPAVQPGAAGTGEDTAPLPTLEDIHALGLRVPGGMDAGEWLEQIRGESDDDTTPPPRPGMMPPRIVLVQLGPGNEVGTGRTSHGGDSAGNPHESRHATDRRRHGLVIPVPGRLKPFASNSQAASGDAAD